MWMRVFTVMVALSFFLSLVKGASRSAEDFNGVKFECGVLPTAATPVWDLSSATPNEAAVASSDGSLLDLNVLSSGYVLYVLPGQCGAAAVPVANRHWPNYPSPDAVNNPWNPEILTTGYTLEISTQVIDSVPATWGYCFWIGEAAGGDGALINLQIFKDKITTSTNSLTLYTGNLTGTQHKIRLVRYPGSVYDPFGDPNVELYVDGVMCHTSGRASNGGIMGGCSWDQDWLMMGSLSSDASYHVKTDYVRVDFTGPYTPPIECGAFGYLKGDFNRDCVVNFKDINTLVVGWLLCSDPRDVSCINCNDPANGQFCR
jgi:hypothetical protein